MGEGGLALAMGGIKMFCTVAESQAAGATVTFGATIADTDEDTDTPVYGLAGWYWQQAILVRPPEFCAGELQNLPSKMAKSALTS